MINFGFAFLLAPTALQPAADVPAELWNLSLIGAAMFGVAGFTKQALARRSAKTEALETGALETAARELIAKLDAAKQHFDSLESLASLQGARYEGPSYDAALEALRVLLPADPVALPRLHANQVPVAKAIREPLRNPRNQ